MQVPVSVAGPTQSLAPGRSVDWNADQRLEAVTVATTGRMLSLLMGLFGGILGLIDMLRVLHDPTIFFPLVRHFGGASAIEGAS